jgi:hypothetical protein
VLEPTLISRHEARGDKKKMGKKEKKSFIVSSYHPLIPAGMWSRNNLQTGPMLEL